MATTISIPCPATVLPTKADLVNIFVELASIPSQIEAEVAKLEERAAFNPNLEEVARVELERQASSFQTVVPSPTQNRWVVFVSILHIKDLSSLQANNALYLRRYPLQLYHALLVVTRAHSMYRDVQPGKWGFSYRLLHV